MHLNNGLDIPPRNRDILETSILEILRTYNASMWLAGPSTGEGNYVDSLGATPLSGTGEAVGYVFDAMSTQLEENEVRNSKMEDAALGSTPPSSFIMGGITGVTTNIVEIGSIDGHRYVDLAVSGTAASTGDLTLIEPNSLGYMDILPNEVATSSVNLALMEGSWPARVTFIGLIERNAGGSFLTNSSVDFRTLVTDGQLVRVSCTRLVTNAAAAFVSMALRITAVQIGDVIDFTIRITQHQVNKGNSTIYFPTPVGSSAPRSKQYIPAYQATTGFKPMLRTQQPNYANYNKRLSQWLVAGATRTLKGTLPEYGEVVEVREVDGGAVSQHYLHRNPTIAIPDSAGVACFSAKIKHVSGVPAVQIQVRNNDNVSYPRVTYNFATGSIVVAGGGVLSAIAEPAEYGFIKLTLRYTIIAGGTPSFVAFMTNGGASAVGDANNAFEVCDIYFTDGMTTPDVYVDTLLNVPHYPNAVPYSWKFDGVDDRLVAAKPAINPAVDHFKIICYRNPPTPPGTLVNLCSIASSSNANAAIARVYTGNGFYHVNAIWRDDAAVSNATLVSRNNANEKLVVTVRRNGVNVTLGVRGDIAVPGNHSAGITYGVASVNNERIGSHAPTNVDSGFWPGEIYGVICGNGAPTAGEILALENFLAGHAGFTPLP